MQAKTACLATKSSGSSNRRSRRQLPTACRSAAPYPPDTLFYRAAQQEFDAVICMYHDQGLIPLKLLHFDDAVNVTLGMPIIRTSVDHGTAYDIAGRNRANAASMIAAIRLAVSMAHNRAHADRSKP